MIKDIACYIEQAVLATGYVSKHFPYAELIRVGESTYPAQYIGKGAYDSLYNIDKTGGNSYLRKNGKSSISQATGVIKPTPCFDEASVLLLRLPYRLVMTVPKSRLSDDAFSDDLLASEMIAALQGGIDLPELQAQDISLTVTDYDTDSLSIWKDEVSGVEHQMDFNYSYIALNLSVNITINSACLERLCAYQ